MSQRSATRIAVLLAAALASEAVVLGTMQPAQASLWLRAAEGRR